MFKTSVFVIHAKDKCMYDEVRFWEDLDILSKFWYIVRHPVDTIKEVLK